MQADQITVSLVSHGQAAFCASLLADLAALAPSSVEKLVFTINIPEQLPPLPELPFPVEFIRNARPLGFGANHNQAFARCASAYFAVLNPDLRLQRDPFPPLIARLADPKVGLVAPLVLEADGRVADFARRMVSPWEVIRRRVVASDACGGIDQPDWLAGMFLVLRSETFSSLRGFDTRYTLYCEDVDLCARLRLRGLRLEVVREVSVTHLAQRASRRSLPRMLMHGSSLLKLWSSPVYRNYQLLLRKEAAEHGEI